MNEIEQIEAAPTPEQLTTIAVAAGRVDYARRSWLAEEYARLERHTLGVLDQDSSIGSCLAFMNGYWRELTGFRPHWERGSVPKAR